MVVIADSGSVGPLPFVRREPVAAGVELPRLRGVLGLPPVLCGGVGCAVRSRGVLRAGGRQAREEGRTGPGGNVVRPSMVQRTAWCNRTANDLGAIAARGLAAWRARRDAGEPPHVPTCLAMEACRGGGRAAWRSCGGSSSTARSWASLCLEGGVCASRRQGCSRGGG
jgi:hypothetical protein